MSSFHDQWMAAFDEMHADPALLANPAEFHEMRAKLSDARFLIEEDNDAKAKNAGGRLIREVRQACRLIREQQAA